MLAFMYFKFKENKNKKCNWHKYTKLFFLCLNYYNLNNFEFFSLFLYVFYLLLTNELIHSDWPYKAKTKRAFNNSLTSYKDELEVLFVANALFI